MWTYILRRLLVMIPTLLGVTIISFCIMQLAPGDPLLAQLGSTGMTGETSQTREAYLIRKRDLNLDKPLVLNFNYFRDYSEEIAAAAYYLGRTDEEILASLPEPGKPAESPEQPTRLKMLRSLGIEDFDARLADPEQRGRLVEAIRAFLQVHCEDTGQHGVPAAVALLRSDETDIQGKLGAIRCLTHMVIDPFSYTYSRDPSPDETPLVEATWRLWWQRALEQDRRRVAEGLAPHWPVLEPQRREALARRFDEITAAESRTELFVGLEQFDPTVPRPEPFRRRDMRFFVEKLLGDSSLREKVVASLALRLYLGKPLATDVPHDVRLALAGENPKQAREQLADVTENWLLYYDLHEGEYQHSLARKLGYILTDTQYATMLTRLVTFQFGRSTLKTREPVGRKILDAVLVSAPLMVLAQLVIYFVAVPLGILCAVNRGNWVDRFTSLGLFLLYSIPPFVAGMLFLLLFCYGGYLKLFPMEGLHSDAAERYGPVLYAVDYLWHIILPVACLSLFSLAGMAMYARTSMLDVIGQDYIRTARAKGLSEEKVILKHGLRNALIPILTLFSNLLPAMLGGSVLIEYLFGIPGMGQLSWESIMLKDYPTLMALIYINAIVVMLSILLTDILYVFVDPRISFAAQGAAA